MSPFSKATGAPFGPEVLARPPGHLPQQVPVIPRERTRLLVVAGALDALPLLPLEREVETNQAVLSATGTDGKEPSKIAPVLAPNLDKPCKSLSSVVKMTAGNKGYEVNQSIDVSPCPNNRKDLLSTSDNRSSVVGDTGLEPVTPSLSS